MKPNHDPRCIVAVLDTRRWVARKQSLLGQPVTDDDLAAHVAKHYPDLKGQHLGYVLTYAKPATRDWPGGPT